MATDTIKQFNEQFEQTFLAPARSFAAAATDHAEAIAGVQIETAKATTELAFSNAREALSIRDPESLQAYVTKQTEVAQQLGEQVKSGADKITAANQAFVGKTQKVAEENVASARKAAEQGVQQVQKTASSATA